MKQKNGLKCRYVEQLTAEIITKLDFAINEDITETELDRVHEVLRGIISREYVEKEIQIH